MANEVFDITSFNCNGLGQKPKRVKIFKWLKREFKGIYCLQETYSIPKIEKSWACNIGHQHKIYFSHGTSNSRGVCIIVPKKLVPYITKTSQDNEGRYIALQFHLEGKNYTVLNVYAPTQEKTVEQLNYLKSIELLLEEFSDSTLIIGGDFNIIQNPILDKYNAKSDQPSPNAKYLEGIKIKYHLGDIWRIYNPTLKRYTWRRRNPLQQSRLDFWLISESIISCIKVCNIGISFLSDHNVINLQIQLTKSIPRGKGFWKMNNSLLKEREYTNLIVNTIKKAESDLNKIDDQRLAWEYLKMVLRRETISYAIIRSKKRREEGKILLQKLQECELKLESQELTNDDVITEYNLSKKDYEMFQSEITRGQMLRSKAQWTEEGERSSKYFIGLEKYKQETKNIKVLSTEPNIETTEPNKILENLHVYYSTLYGKKNVNTEGFTRFVPVKTLNENVKTALDSNITLKECKEALDGLPCDKTPGTDGLTAEFYRHFWSNINHYLYNSIMSSIELGELSIEQRRGVITLIPKPGKDIKQVKNWRPISILNVDYKIIAKILANRLKYTLPDLICSDQLAYVQDRIIGENLRIVKDIIDYAKIHNIEGLLLLVDFEKAFDSLDRSFLEHTLQSYGFGSKFINLVKLLYTNISSVVLNNGFTTNSFELHRGIRQGCPVSAYFFILCAELLADAIRQDLTIRGLSIHQHTYKILQYADDAILIAKDLNDINKILALLKDFGECSGLKMNIDKSELFDLGKSENRGARYKKLKWCTDSFKYLGIWFNKSEPVMEYKNFRHRLDNIINQFKIWRQRDLSLKGKITIIRTLALSQLLYTTSVLSIPEWVVKEANNLFYKFLWNNKPDKIRRDIITRDIESGGLKMVNLEAMIYAQKITWAKKLYKESNSKWANIACSFFNTVSINDFMCSNYTENYLPPYLPQFYRQCLLALSEIKTDSKPENACQMLIQPLWFNKHIQVGKGMTFYFHWYLKGIKHIKDIIGDNGKPMSPQEISKVYGINTTNFMEYHSLIKAIPTVWKKCIANKGTNQSSLSYDVNILYVKIKNNHRDICYSYNNDFYWSMVQSKAKPAVPAETAWAKQFGVQPENLKQYYLLPFRYIKQTKIQSMQYKIIHGIYACNLKLFHWKIKPSNLCSYCNEVDNTVHHFYTCKEMALFWHTFHNWWSNICKKCIICKPLTPLQVLLGVTEQICHKTQLNYLILLAKWYIFRTKYLEKQCFFVEFLTDIKNNLETEKVIYYKNNQIIKFIEMWQAVYDNI